MRALDTNILVRFLTNDDQKQAAKVRRLLEEAESSGESFLVTGPVVLELLWVLAAVYQYTRDEILDAIEQLTLMPVFAFEAPNRVNDLVATGRASTLDLPDIFIGLGARDLGADHVVTLDRKAARDKLFQLVR